MGAGTAGNKKSPAHAGLFFQNRSGGKSKGSGGKIGSYHIAYFYDTLCKTKLQVF